MSTRGTTIETGHGTKAERLWIPLNVAHDRIILSEVNNWLKEVNDMSIQMPKDDPEHAEAFLAASRAFAAAGDLAKAAYCRAASEAMGYYVAAHDERVAKANYEAAKAPPSLLMRWKLWWNYSKER